jgi:hypothetical protein
MPLQPATLPQPARHGLEPATRNLKPVTCNLFHTQVFKNKIAAQLPLSNEIHSRQSNLSTTASKQRLMQWNQILKRRGAQSPIFEKNTHFELSPRHADPAFPNLEPPAPLSAIRYQAPAINQKTRLLDNFYFRIKYITGRGHVDRLCTNKPQPPSNQIDKLSRPHPSPKRKLVFFTPRASSRPARTIPVLNSFS